MQSDFSNQAIPPDFNLAMQRLWQRAGALVAGGCDYPTFFASMHEEHLKIAKYNAGFVDWQGASLIVRMLWKQIPSPALDYACPSLPEPGRNEPCLCGSGRKFKHCCQPLLQSFPVPEVNGLILLLDALPRKRWRELVGSRVSVPMVEATALEWQQLHNPELVIALLEPWFKQDTAFTAKYECLLDDLLNAYGETDHPRKKERLLEQAVTLGDDVIRSSALQRRASMLADRGDYAAAWRTFTQAQRANPNAVSLSHLEVTILLDEGRNDEARDRARFWIKRLQALRNPELDGLIALLRDLAERGTVAVTDKLLTWNPQLGELAAALKQAPPLRCLYTLDPGEHETGPLRPVPALRKALSAWYECMAGSTPPSLRNGMFEEEDETGEIEDWLPVLREHPVLWNAFEVLDEIVMTLKDSEGATFTQTLACPLLDRAEQLLQVVLQHNAAEGKRFEWGWLENRPALSLLGERITLEMPKLDARQLARLEWLVLTLNPNDNQGFRDVLMRAYLEHSRIADALALSDRYPEDYGNMHYNRVLALFAADRQGDALAALQDAMESAPKFAAWLLKTNPKPPRQGKWGITVGSDEEAWLYRQDTLRLWEQLGAIDWLRAAIKALAKRRRTR